MSGFQRPLGLMLTVFCGVVGGYYSFQPVFAADALKHQKATQEVSTPSELNKDPASASKL